jgi:hypothetical protein
MKVLDFEALCPVVFGLVLEFETEEFVVHVGEARLGSNLGVANSTGLLL